MSSAAGFRRADACAAALSGAIAGAAWHGSLGAFTSAPAWVMLACAMALGAAAHRRSVEGRSRAARPSQTRFAGALLLGVAIGVALPSGLPPPGGVVVTHWRPLPLAASPQSALFAALDLLDRRPDALLGERIVVDGRWHPGRGADSAAVSQTVMACCAADAIEVGFDVVPVGAVHLRQGAMVRVSGVVSQTLHGGEVRFALSAAAVRPLLSNGGNTGAR